MANTVKGTVSLDVSADALQSYTGYEKKRVGHMYSVLTELLTEQRIGGESIQDWSLVKVLQSHAD